MFGLIRSLKLKRKMYFSDENMLEMMKLPNPRAENPIRMIDLVSVCLQTLWIVKKVCLV